jgi:hypothetical protein
LELHLLFEVQLLFAPHDESFPDFALGQAPLHSFLGAVAHPVTKPAIAAMTRIAFA